jgi:hypothetical protein
MPSSDWLVFRRSFEAKPDPFWFPASDF